RGDQDFQVLPRLEGAEIEEKRLAAGVAPPDAPLLGLVRTRREDRVDAVAGDTDLRPRLGVTLLQSPRGRVRNAQDPCRALGGPLPEGDEADDRPPGVPRRMRPGRQVVQDRN